MLKIWENLCRAFTPEQLTNILRRMVPGFRPVHDSLDSFIKDNAFDKAAQIGMIEYNGPRKSDTIWQGKSDTHVEVVAN
jgi:hypothetical protein